MKTTTKPQIAATAASRVRPRRDDAFSPAEALYWFGWFAISLQRPHEHGRPLDDSDREEQQNHNAERERDGDRPLTTAFLLRLGEDDSLWSVVVGHECCHAPLPDRRCDGADDDLDQKGRKQRKQIKDREREKLTCGARRFTAFAEAVDVDRERQHAGAEDQRDDVIRPIEIASR